jgi:hypothetical protein
MGIKKKPDIPPKPFTKENRSDRDLVIKMLRFEDSLLMGPVGAKIYAEPSYQVTKSLDSEYAFHRITLDHFGFDTTDQSTEIYRGIPMAYYRLPTDYDVEVLDSVAYTRNNKCLYYTEPEIKIGDILPDCPLYNLDGSLTSIKETLGEFNHAFVAAYSNS